MYFITLPFTGLRAPFISTFTTVQYKIYLYFFCNSRTDSILKLKLFSKIKALNLISQIFIFLNHHIKKIKIEENVNFDFYKILKLKFFFGNLKHSQNILHFF